MMRNPRAHGTSNQHWGQTVEINDADAINDPYPGIVNRQAFIMITQPASSD